MSDLEQIAQATISADPITDPLQRELRRQASYGQYVEQAQPPTDIAQQAREAAASGDTGSALQALAQSLGWRSGIEQEARSMTGATPLIEATMPMGPGQNPLVRWSQGAMGPELIAPIMPKPKPVPRLRALGSMERVPVEPESLNAAPDVRVTPGQSSLEMVMGPNALERQQRNALMMTRDQPKQAAKIEAVRGSMISPSEAKRIYEEGKFAEQWYTGAYPEIQRSVGSRDALSFAKMIAATSPRADPLYNVDNAFQAYLKWVREGRPPLYQFDPSFMQGYRINLQRAINMVRDAKTGVWTASPEYVPIEGMKVSNYLLDILGSEQHPTVDRWIVNTILKKPSAKADVTAAEYQATADFLQQVAPRLGTTPVRLQAGLWTGQKMLHDPRVYRLVEQGLTREQAVPSLREVIRYKADQYRQLGLLPPAGALPSIVLGMYLAESGYDPHSIAERVRDAEKQAGR